MYNHYIIIRIFSVFQKSKSASFLMFRKKTPSQDFLEEAGANEKSEVVLIGDKNQFVLPASNLGSDDVNRFPGSIADLLQATKPKVVTFSDALQQTTSISHQEEDKSFFSLCFLRDLFEPRWCLELVSSNPWKKTPQVLMDQLLFWYFYVPKF